MLNLHYFANLLSTAYEINFVFSVCEKVYCNETQLWSYSTIAVQLRSIMGFYLKFLGSFSSFLPQVRRLLALQQKTREHIPLQNSQPI